MAHSLGLHYQVDLEMKRVCYRADKDDKDKLEDDQHPGRRHEKRMERALKEGGPERKGISTVKRRPSSQVDNHLWC